MLPAGVLLNQEDRYSSDRKRCVFSDGIVKDIAIADSCLSLRAVQTSSLPASGSAESLAPAAAAPSAPASDPYGPYGNVDLCRAMKSARKAKTDEYPALVAALAARGVAEKSCSNRINIGKILVGALLIGAAVAVVAAAASGGAPSNASGATDYQWSWDQFANEYGVYVWRCRGHQTGEFADDYRCASDARVDTTWPGK